MLLQCDLPANNERSPIIASISFGERVRRARIRQQYVMATRHRTLQ
jgi:hypothetical protein